jgi:hypothetical protein
MSQDATPRKIILPCGEGIISTLFVHDTVGKQAAANSVYVNVSTVNGQYNEANPSRPKKQIFKSDRERMQYILGRLGTETGCTTLY